VSDFFKPEAAGNARESVEISREVFAGRRFIAQLLLSFALAACSSTPALSQPKYKIPDGWTTKKANSETTFLSPDGKELLSILPVGATEHSAKAVVASYLNPLAFMAPGFKVLDARVNSADTLAASEVQFTTNEGTYRERFIASTGSSSASVLEFMAPASLFDREERRVVIGGIDPSLHEIGARSKVASAPAHTAARGVPAALHRIDVVRLRLVQAPSGAFTVSVPQGNWQVSEQNLGSGAPLTMIKISNEPA